VHHSRQGPASVVWGTGPSSGRPREQINLRRIKAALWLVDARLVQSPELAARAGSPVGFPFNRRHQVNSGGLNDRRIWAINGDYTLMWMQYRLES
jgi:hypothetical protein